MKDLIEQLRLNADGTKGVDGLVDPVMAGAWKGLGALLDEAADALERHLWIPVEEGLPEPMVPVLCWYPGCIPEVLYEKLGEQPGYWQSEEGWAHDNRDPKTLNVTHWMPLPEPPEQ